MEEKEFAKQLQEAVQEKQEWFNSECLQNMLTQYRLVHSCIKNLYEMLVRRSIITDDPYRLDKKIVDVVIPDSTPFPEQEMSTIFGARLSDYETMLDYICTYYRFSVDNMNIPAIKKLLDFNNYFDWKEVSTNNKQVSTKALATVLENARSGADGVVQSMITDTINKCNQTIGEINKELNELGNFQKEFYKCELRKDLFEHPQFKADKAKESAESEYAEIKRLFPKVIGKRPFYNDLINEIVKEDHSADKEKRQEAVLAKLKINSVASKVVKKKAAPEPKELLLSAVISVGILAPIISKLRGKLMENFDLLYIQKKTFWGKLIASLKKAFGIKDKEREVLLPIKDSISGSVKVQKIKVADFLYELGKRERIYNAIGTKGAEYTKIANSSEDSILQFLNKNISEMQGIYNIVNSLDGFFKNEVDITLKVRIRGMQMDLSTLRNSIINVNKKRGEYVSFKEETEQMKKLGIVDEE